MYSLTGRLGRVIETWCRHNVASRGMGWKSQKRVCCDARWLSEEFEAIQYLGWQECLLLAPSYIPWQFDTPFHAPLVKEMKGKEESQVPF